MTHIAAEQDIRYYLNGVMVEIGTQECRLVATDGHILAVYRLHGDKDSKSVDLSHELAQQLAENGSLQVIIPIEEVKAIKKQRTYANLILKIEPEQRKFPNDDKNNELVRFGSLMDPSGRGSETRFQFINGAFPDYRRVIPRKIEKADLKPTYFSWTVMQCLMKANVELGASTLPMPVITQCGNAGLVRFTDPNMVGVAMPYPHRRAADRSARVELRADELHRRVRGPAAGHLRASRGPRPRLAGGPTRRADRLGHRARDQRLLLPDRRSVLSGGGLRRNEVRGGMGEAARQEAEDQVGLRGPVPDPQLRKVRGDHWRADHGEGRPPRREEGSMTFTPEQRALLGAIEMLTKIARGETYSALEYHTRLLGYRDTLLKAKPELESDPYFGPILARLQFPQKPLRETPLP